VTLQIVVPMAGRGSRFADAGYDRPKPLIDVAGRTMIDRVVENLRPSRPHRFVFLVLAEHAAQHDVARHLDEIAPACAVVEVSSVTEGAACTVLLAEPEVADDEPLLIANSDQWIKGGIGPFLDAWDEKRDDGFIMTMRADDPKWSFIRFGPAGEVVEVVEKVVVSEEATVGVYAFVRASEFFDGARAMIEADERVNGEFYVAPVYNQLIRAGRTIGFHNVGSERDGMHGLGTPADLEEFMRSVLATGEAGR
jgi:NDP-sugar pyrophosphorylase family protein